MARLLRSIAGPIVLAAALVLLTPTVGAAHSASAHSASAQSKDGLRAASHLLADRVELRSTQAVAGSPISGTLVVVNHGAKRMELTSSCGPGFYVTLVRPQGTTSSLYAGECSPRPFITVSPGTNRFPVTVSTDDCPAGGDSSAPACPPLPPSRYETMLVGFGIALPEPRPVFVTLVAGG